MITLSEGTTVTIDCDSGTAEIDGNIEIEAQISVLNHSEA